MLPSSLLSRLQDHAFNREQDRTAELLSQLDAANDRYNKLVRSRLHFVVSEEKETSCRSFRLLLCRKYRQQPRHSPPRISQTAENGDLFARLTEIDALVSALRSELAAAMSSQRALEDERDRMKARESPCGLLQSCRSPCLPVFLQSELTRALAFIVLS